MLKSVYNLTVLKNIKFTIEPLNIVFQGIHGTFLFPRIFKIEINNNELFLFPSIVNFNLIRRLYPNINKFTDQFLRSCFLTKYNQLCQLLLGNIVLYKSELRFIGVGYKVKNFSKNKNFLQMDLGLSHLSLIIIPKLVQVSLISNTRLIIRCNDKQVLFQFIRALKRKAWPNVYTGKGIIIKGEKLRKKAIVK